MRNHPVVNQALALLVPVVLLAGAAQEPEIPPPDVPTQQAPDRTAEGLVIRLDRAMKNGNLETALYIYRSLYHVTGQEDPARLARLSEMVLVDEARRARGWLKISAAEALARRGSESGLAALRAALTDDSLGPPQRAHAMQVLGETGDRESIPTLQQVVYDDARTTSEQFAAVDALLDFGDLHGVPYLVRILKGADPGPKRRAISLVQEHELALLEPLRAVAHGEDADLALDATCALGQQGDEAALADLREILGDPSSAEIPEYEIPPVAEGTPSTDMRDYRDMNRRVRAAEVLILRGDPGAVSLYEALIASPRSPYDPTTLANVIGKVDPARAVKLYESILAGPFPSVSRIRAAAELAPLGKAGAVVELLGPIYDAAIQDPDDAFRMALVRMLARTRPPGSTEFLRRAMTADPSGAIQLEAARGLAPDGDPAALKLLRDRLEGVDRLEAISAADALMQLPPAPSVSS